MRRCYTRCALTLAVVKARFGSGQMWHALEVAWTAGGTRRLPCRRAMESVGGVLESDPSGFRLVRAEVAGTSVVTAARAVRAAVADAASYVLGTAEEWYEEDIIPNEGRLMENADSSEASSSLRVADVTGRPDHVSVQHSERTGAAKRWNTGGRQSKSRASHLQIRQIQPLRARTPALHLTTQRRGTATERLNTRATVVGAAAITRWTTNTPPHPGTRQTHLLYTIAATTKFAASCFSARTPSSNVTPCAFE